MVGKRPALVAALVGMVAAAALGSSTAPGAPAEGNRLLRFGACSDFLDYMKQNAAPAVTAWGFLGRGGVEAVGPPPPPAPVPPGLPVPTPGGPVPAPTPPLSTPAVGKTSAPEEDDFSTTNVQEAGVDEPDIVKSNGSTLFAVADGRLHSVAVRGGEPRRLDSLPLAGGARHDLLLHGDTLLVLSYEDSDVEPQPDGPRRLHSSILPGPLPQPPPPTTTLAQVDVSQPGWLRVVRRLTFEGRYVDARLVKGSARVVFTSSGPSGLRFFYPRYLGAPEEALARNRGVVAESKAGNWLPSFEVRNVRTKVKRKRSVQCRHVARPTRFSGFGMLTVLTIDLDKGLDPVEADAVLADGDTVYASEGSLYVATQPWQEVVGEPARTQSPGTALHKFDISSPDRTAYRASGSIGGHLLNQWSLSEHERVLRVATTEFPIGSTRFGSESVVTTLKEDSGKLVQIGRVGGLGRGERIFGVRFIGDVGYVVTFRQVDPLYTVDLSNPARPRLAGELKIPGYSAYLHPAAEDLLLGLGQDAGEDGATVGMQLSVFDVSDLRKPVRLHHRTIEGTVSEAETDHHAFLYWRKTRLVVVPVETWSSDRMFAGVVAFRIGRDRLDEVGRITHGRGKLFSFKAWSSAKPIRRTLVVRDILITVSEAGVRANDVRTFADRGWAPFG